MFDRIAEILEGLVSAIGEDDTIVYIAQHTPYWLGAILLFCILGLFLRKFFPSQESSYQPSKTTSTSQQTASSQPNDPSRDKNGSIITPPPSIIETSKMVIYDDGKPVWKSFEKIDSPEKEE
jgi:hypothetical protein